MRLVRWNGPQIGRIGLKPTVPGICATIIALFLTTGTHAETTILAEWTYDLGSGYWLNATLESVSGKAVLRSTYSDGSSGTDDLVDRPSKDPSTRRFDIKGSDEWIVVSLDGEVHCHDSEGWIGSARASIRDALRSRESVQSSEDPCVPTSLSAHSRETIELYRALQRFKSEAAFARVGLSGRPYSDWMKRVEALDSSKLHLKVAKEIGFLPTELISLARAYLTGGDAGTWERVMQRGIDHALCVLGE